MKKMKISLITDTAAYLALLLVLQYISKPMGQFVTGGLVNLMLISAVLLTGIYSGIAVALISPFLAFMMGIGPGFIQIVPIIALGNIALVVVYSMFFKYTENSLKSLTAWGLSILVGSLLKFLLLYFGIVKAILPIIPNLKDKQIAVISAAFSWTQLVTAVIGGVLAFILVPILKKAIYKAK